ncbi:CDP-diacylglycerol--glycerol-3-phosphate 3-phosphatidyltransferase [Candidatus Venteria ishoeyi]|uniref:CDP-diacylglycerol--glycerol-3-phosphate 3-phosphatidyltransferase n=1 Tax=Candidatus Venteria ishoeyi TaxID=1899563 RepID=A0A1H6FE11_9GAMM|nr:CDP-diacylglycerol--glycerol-3-phosphate 3-phosphatidyltransferase [Candidatus Venteria ishoeyi]MDM8545848.1 CDP-diacylglycerol--glycerol-3-phosphate 3-phosphatidyltransferase [Candidatus Venteria ishoeyi]SEH08308.1 CDP-diacylglycerol--glycerol-3-phosphate 3-phosphatidyltransferase [Candidatus Venteria ishoeyi]
MNLPNILTLIRIALVPVFILVFYLPFSWSSIAAMYVFLLASLTDWLDGYLARKYQQTTAFGAFLDPVADKLIVAVALVVLVSAYPTLWMSIPAAIIIGREIIISALREWMAAEGKRSEVAVSDIGKWKTTVQMLAMLFLIYQVPLFGVIPVIEIGYVLLYIAVFLTLWSMVSYLRAALPVLLASDKQ